MDILRITGLQKAFGSQQVLKGVELCVPEHSVFGFIGQNGAGKTTTMKLILGLITMDAGEISIHGEKVKYGDNKTNQSIGYLSDVPSFYGYMTAKEYLRLCVEVSGRKSKQASEQIEELLTLTGLQKYEKKRIHGYSRGMKQRLGIAQALLNDPKLLICDEPTSALDPIGRKEVLTILSAVKEKTTVLFSTHILSDVERICDEIAILHDGVIAKKGRLIELKEQIQQNHLSITMRDEADVNKIVAYLQNLHHVRIEKENLSLQIQANDIETVQMQVMDFMVKQQMYPIHILCEEPTLEDVFMEVVK